MITYLETYDAQFLIDLLPLDAKSCNYYKDGDTGDIVITSITDYLGLFDQSIRSAGSIVTVLIDKAFADDPYSSVGGSYTIDNFRSTALANYDVKYYAFVGGIADEHFVPIPSGDVSTGISIIGNGRKTNVIRLVNDVSILDPYMYYGSAGTQDKGYHLFPGTETTMSVTGSGKVLEPIKLVNDQDIVGDFSYYGTAAGSAKGFFPIPGLGPQYIGPQGYQGAQGTTGAGVQGPQGYNGIDGPQGPQGYNGVDGTQGPQGATGPQGERGITGNPGPQGIIGAQGPQGVEGLNGPQGMSGPQGAQGAPGIDGAQGPQGIDGLNGAQGMPGPQGAQGASGAQGPQGIDGLNGPQGMSGPQGAQGPAGLQGPQGVPGPQGTDGTQGPQGVNGLQGPQGTPGPQGYQGTAGLPGPQGYQGTAGLPGPQGYQGTAGVQGPQGAQGPRGFQGNRGYQGTQGADGIDGAPGPQGVQGAQGADGIDGAQGAQGASSPQIYVGYQENHGFTIGDCIKPYISGWVRTLGLIGSAGTVGIVKLIIDSNTFEYIVEGLLLSPGTYVVGGNYFLSTTAPGTILILPDPEVWNVGEIREFIGTGTLEGLMIELDLGDIIQTVNYSTHNPVTINSNSATLASIDANQVLTINNQSVSSNINQLVYGTITWLHDYVFRISECGYYIQGVYYTSPLHDVTLNAPDAIYDRIDTFYVNADPISSFISGIPTEVPLQSELDPLTQLLLQNVSVKTGSTSPPTINDDVVYDENVEWTSNIEAALYGATVDFEDTTSPYNGLVQTRVTFASTYFDHVIISYTKYVDVNIINSNLILAIRISRPLASTQGIYIRIKNSLNNVGTEIIIKDGTYGFNSSLTDYQEITIPISDFNPTQNLINVVWIGFVNGLTTGILGITTVDFDYIRIQKGIAPINFTEIDPIFNEWLLSYHPVTIAIDSSAIASIDANQVLSIVPDGFSHNPVTIATDSSALASIDANQVLTIVPSSSSTFKPYTILATQSGTSDPTVIVLENTIGIIVPTRTAVGTYRFTSSGLFTTDKTAPVDDVMMDQLGNLYTLNNIDTNYFELKTYPAANISVLGDNILNKRYISISVYN